MALTKAERELLARLDERSINTWNSVEKIEKHLEKSNDRQRKTEGRLNKLIGGLMVIAVLVGGGLGIYNIVT